MCQLGAYYFMLCVQFYDISTFMYVSGSQVDSHSHCCTSICMFQVHVMIHIPPGLFEATSHYMAFRPEQNTAFNELMREYGDVILGIYAGHSHSDTFRLFYKDGRPLIPHSR